MVVSFLVSNDARTSMRWLSKYKVREMIEFENKLKNGFFLVRFITEEKVLEIEVEPGVADGYQIPFLAEG